MKMKKELQDKSFILNLFLILIRRKSRIKSKLDNN